MREVRAGDLRDWVTAVGHAVRRPARLYLMAATSHLAEGWREGVPRVDAAGPPDLAGPAGMAAAATGLPLRWESPADVIPLPDGWEERARPAAAPLQAAARPLDVWHFDPYSVVLRLVARGDEADYATALAYLQHGWVEWARLEALLADVVPRFTNATLAQDPAEFRRKFRGLRQLFQSRHP